MHLGLTKVGVVWADHPLDQGLAGVENDSDLGCFDFLLPQLQQADQVTGLPAL